MYHDFPIILHCLNIMAAFQGRDSSPSHTCSCELWFRGSDDSLCHCVQFKAMRMQAEAIISNPPVYAHIHCAEKLGVPLHMFLCEPGVWSPRGLGCSAC